MDNCPPFQLFFRGRSTGTARFFIYLESEAKSKLMCGTLTFDLKSEMQAFVKFLLVTVVVIAVFGISTNFYVDHIRFSELQIEALPEIQQKQLDIFLEI